MLPNECEIEIIKESVPGVSIESDNVVIDLNGFKIETFRQTDKVSAIFEILYYRCNYGNYVFYDFAAVENITIKNGIIGKNNGYSIFAETLHRLFLQDIAFVEFTVYFLFFC